MRLKKFSIIIALSSILLILSFLVGCVTEPTLNPPKRPANSMSK